MTIFCPKCGNSSSSEDNFCRNCGARLVSASIKVSSVEITAQPLKCEYCGSIINKEEQRGLCIECKKPMCKYCQHPEGYIVHGGCDFPGGCPKSW